MNTTIAHPPGRLAARAAPAAALRLAPPAPAVSRPRGRLGERVSLLAFRLGDLLADAQWLVLSAALNRCATAKMRRNAWEDGFSLAFGGPGRCQWTRYLHEYTEGNERGLDIRERGLGACSAAGPLPAPEMFLVRLGAEREA